MQVQEKLAEYKGQPFTMQTMAVIKNMVEGWCVARSPCPAVLTQH